MKKLLTLPLLFLCMYCTAQQFINGDFEDNTSTGCNYNLLNTDFNSLMSDVTAFGPNEEVDIQEGICYGTAPSGVAFISLAVQNDLSLLVDAVTLSLNGNFQEGYPYTISFYLTGNNDFGGNGDSIEIGVSTSSTDFGEKVFTHFPNLTQWEQISFTFTSPMDANYLSVRNQGAVYGWTFVDDFQIAGKANGIESIPSEDITIQVTSYNHLLCSCPYELNNLAVFNTCGQLMTSSGAGTHADFNITGWSGGIYFLRCMDNDGRIFSKKVIL